MNSKAYHSVYDIQTLTFHLQAEFMINVHWASFADGTTFILLQGSRESLTKCCHDSVHLKEQTIVNSEKQLQIVDS